MTELHVLRVFVGDGGRHGNALGVVLDGPAVAPGRRQGIAKELGYSETVFVDDAPRGEVRIFTPAAELPFAGHPSVGTAWLLAEVGRPVEVLRPPAGEVPVRRDGELVFVAARPEWGPAFELIELPSPADVDALASPPDGAGLAAYWAWEDERAGLVRARVFPVELGIAEDEATGSATGRLGAVLGRDLTVRQGAGSVIHVCPHDDGLVEVGGVSVLDEVREVPSG